jgi:hypothetical protein
VVHLVSGRYAAALSIVWSGSDRGGFAGGPPAANCPRAAGKSAQEPKKPGEVSNRGMRYRVED